MDASLLPNSLFSGNKATFATVLSQTRATEESELRRSLDPILPVRGVITREDGRKGVVFDRIVVWEGSTIPSSYTGIYSRIYIVNEVGSNGVEILVQGSTEDESMEFVLPVQLREPLITIKQ
jgi:hypothetical protein